MSTTTKTRGPIPGSSGMPDDNSIPTGEAATATPSPVDVAEGARDAAEDVQETREERDRRNQMICDGNTAASDVAFRINCLLYTSDAADD